MRKEYGAALREVFTQLLTSVSPLFLPVKIPPAFAVVPGERAYCWRVSETLSNWVVLVPDQKREAFTIEVGWSRQGRFPQLTMRPSAIRPDEAGGEDEYLCRLGELSRGGDWWWSIEELSLDATQEQMLAYILAQTQPISPEVARARVTPLVREALGELERFGLPFLRAHAQPGAAGDPPRPARP